MIDTEQKTIEYVNAGHPSGYALVDDKTLVHLNRGSCAVGFFDEIDVQKQFIQYNEDVQIILYTDGVLEAMGPCEMESEKHLQTLISTKWDHSRRLIDHILPKEKQGNQPDDMCVLMIQVH